MCMSMRAPMWLGQGYVRQGATRSTNARPVQPRTTTSAHLALSFCLAGVQRSLNIPMLRHQKLALAWMCRREQSKRVSGGILADDQGLGKTVTTIALILAHPRGGDYLQVCRARSHPARRSCWQ